MLLLCALIVGSGSLWAETVTLTENFSSSGASNDQYDCGSSISTASNQTDWNYAWTTSGSGTVFNHGIKLGARSAVGSVTNTTMLLGVSTGTSITIKIYAARWSSDTGNLTVTYNGDSESKAPSNSAITTTSNTYSASDFSSSTNFTITKAEGVTSFSIASSTKRIIIDKVEVVYDDGPAKSANDLAWSAASKSVTYSETPYGLPSLSNPHSLAITYESSNESVATVASDGTVTVKNVTGNTSISAHTDGNGTYAAGTVSYTLNVTRKVVIEDGVFNFGFGPSDGGDYGSGMSQSSLIIENESETWTAGNVTLVVANRYAWNTDGKMVIYRKAGGANAAGSITISCPAEKAITRIEFTGPYSGTGALSNFEANKGTYTVSSSSAIWTGSAQSVTFTTVANSTYINTISVTYGSTVPVSIGSTEWATFVSDVSLNFSGTGVNAYIIIGNSGSAITKSEALETVPANTPLLLNATEGNYNIPVVASSSTDVSGNLLKAGTGEEVTAEGGKTKYVLAAVGEPAVATFLKITTTSATVHVGKAYLEFSGAVPAPSLRIVEEDQNATGIDNIEASDKAVKFIENGRILIKKNGIVYDALGRIIR